MLDVFTLTLAKNTNNSTAKIYLLSFFRLFYYKKVAVKELLLNESSPVMNVKKIHTVNKKLNTELRLEDYKIYLDKQSFNQMILFFLII